LASKTLKNKILLFSFVSLLALQIFFIFAESALAAEINYPKLPGATPPQEFLNTAPKNEILSLYINYFLNLIFWIVGIIAFFVLVISGIRFLTSAGKPEAMTSAKGYISSAFFGILVLLSSYLILKTINPQILISEPPTLTPSPEIKREDIPEPPTEDYNSLINFEIPFGPIIKKKIFETQIPKGETESPRLARIEDIANNILDASDALEIQNGALKLLVDQCRCKVTDTLTPSLCVANPAPLPCSSDPCGDKDLFHIRVGIILLQGQNKKQIDKIVAEQIKAENEVLLLKEESSRLTKIQDLMTSCPTASLSSLANFANGKDLFTSLKLNLVNFRYWNDIVLDLKNDWSTFYCPSGGSIWEAIIYTLKPTNPQELEFLNIFGMLGEPSVSQPSAEGGTIAACAQTIPVGEIIDRAKRVTDKLTERLEKLLSLSKEMTGTVDEMQRTISQCTSQLPKCVSVDDPLFCTRVRCFGPVDQLGSLEALEKIIADTQAACVKECTFDEDLDGDCFQDCFKEEFNDTADSITDFPPCPFDFGKGKYVHELKVEEMGELLNGIPGLGIEGIKDVVKFEPKDLETDREKIGIVPLIDKIIHRLLDDLDSKITEPMRTCINTRSASGSNQTALLNCGDAIGTKTENGVLERCCFDEIEYKKCEDRCYLKNGNNYRECLLKCQKEESQKTEIRELATCQNKLNFFCCSQ